MPFLDELLQAEFDDRDHASTEALDLGRIDVGAHHLVTHVGETRPRGQAHVARADDSDLGHGVERLPLRLLASMRAWRAIRCPSSRRST